jgi:hypothetical protein
MLHSGQSQGTEKDPDHGQNAAQPMGMQGRQGYLEAEEHRLRPFLSAFNWHS